MEPRRQRLPIVFPWPDSSPWRPRVSSPSSPRPFRRGCCHRLVAAIPLTAATRGWRRRPLLLTAIGGFALVNTITAVSTSYALTLGARFLAGVFAGLLWALLAGYASRMVPAHLRGRAIAVAMVGTPLALSLGVPTGTFLGAAVGWRSLDTLGVASFPWALVVLLLPTLLVAWRAERHGFPPVPRP